MNRVARARRQAHAVLAFAGITIILLLGALINRPDSTPSPASLMQAALDQLSEAGSYSLVVEENASGHKLLFQGRVEEGTLAGFIPGYDLEVLYRDNDLLVRQSGAEEWQEAAALELQGLTGFLTNPLVVLKSQNNNFQHAAAGTEISLAGISCRTVYLEIVEKEHFIALLFPDFDTSMLESASLGLALAEDDLTVRQMRVLLGFTGAETGLERAYYLHFE